jgi:hypothetical protein
LTLLALDLKGLDTPPALFMSYELVDWALLTI